MLSAQNIFVLGIKGVAMANLAVILKKMGKQVTGTDVEEEFITNPTLIKHAVPFTTGFDTKNLPQKTDCFVYSAAHGGVDNPLAIEAKKRGIPLVSQTELLGQIMQKFKTTIAVTGCHGKTTTASLLTYTLIKLEKNPSYLTGSPSFGNHDGGDLNRADYFVIEADEYGVNPPIDKTPKFNFLHPQYIICTNIDYDHPDVYKDLESTKQSFLKFFDKRKIIACSDDPHLMSVVQNLPREQYQTYGFSKNADYVISGLKSQEAGETFELLHNGSSLASFSIDLYGEKNASNAAAVIVTLLVLGFAPEMIRKSLSGFTGAKRRFEKVFEKNNTVLLDDYAHHPHEITATVSAARQRFPSARIIVVFQPHTYSRTQSLLKEFAEALSLADRAYVLPIFPSARETVTKFTVRSEDIVKNTSGSCQAVLTPEILVDQLVKVLRPKDVVITMGAGDVYKLKDDIIKIISNL